MNSLHRRILDISYKKNLSHLSSCLTAVDIIDEIYKERKNDEPFVLSQGHTGLALYTVLEKHNGVDAEMLFDKHGVHPNRDEELGLYCSTGSLGCGLPIALGMAAANERRNVYCLISDGECAEGSIWESLMIKKKYKINNLIIYVNINGSSAYDLVDVKDLKERLWSFDSNIRVRDTNVDDYPFLSGIDGHYYKMKKEDYEQA